MAWRITRVNRYILRFSGDHQNILRSSRPEVFCRKCVLRSFTNSQESTCARVSFLIKLRAWGKPKVKVNTFNFIKKENLAQVFSCEFCQIFKNSFFTEHFWVTAFDHCFWRMCFTLLLLYQQHHGLVRKNVYLHGEEKRPL